MFENYLPANSVIEARQYDSSKELKDNSAMIFIISAMLDDTTFINILSFLGSNRYSIKYFLFKFNVNTGFEVAFNYTSEKFGVVTSSPFIPTNGKELLFSMNSFLKETLFEDASIPFLSQKFIQNLKYFNFMTQNSNLNTISSRNLDKLVENKYPKQLSEIFNQKGTTK
jgi:hypothetical protein